MTPLHAMIKSGYSTSTKTEVLTSYIHTVSKNLTENTTGYDGEDGRPSVKKYAYSRECYVAS